MKSIRAIRSKENEFFDIGRKLLTDFQYIEVVLRRYLALCYDITKKRLAGHLDYRRDTKELQKWSLGTLAKEAKIYCPNKKLIGGIESWVQTRNEIAHSLFIRAHEEAYDEQFLETKTKEMKKIKILTEHIIICLHDEERRTKSPDNALQPTTGRCDDQI